MAQSEEKKNDGCFHTLLTGVVCPVVVGLLVLLVAPHLQRFIRNKTVLEYVVTSKSNLYEPPENLGEVSQLLVKGEPVKNISSVEIGIRNNSGSNLDNLNIKVAWRFKGNESKRLVHQVLFFPQKRVFDDLRWQDQPSGSHSTNSPYSEKPIVQLLVPVFNSSDNDERVKFALFFESSESPKIDLTTDKSGIVFEEIRPGELSIAECIVATIAILPLIIGGFFVLNKLNLWITEKQVEVFSHIVLGNLIKYCPWLNNKQLEHVTRISIFAYANMLKGGWPTKKKGEELMSEAIFKEDTGNTK